MKRVHDIIDVLFVGATGVGKSSTINCLINQDAAAIGHNNDSETKVIRDYMCKDIRLWDTPGLGDVVNDDIRYTEMIKNKLLARAYNVHTRFALIDMVVIVLDARSRDMGTAFHLLDIVLGFIDNNRIIVALNQADIADKRSNFNLIDNEPNKTLKAYLENKRISVAKRINDSIGEELKVVYYSAKTGYNKTVLLDAIIDNAPYLKRDLGTRLYSPHQMLEAKKVGYYE